MRYTIAFVGRTKGAIGIDWPIRAEVDGDTEQAAVLALYDRYDHISFPKVVAEDGRHVPARKVDR